jgi:hypothetical protein
MTGVSAGSVCLLGPADHRPLFPQHHRAAQTIPQVRGCTEGTSACRCYAGASCSPPRTDRRHRAVPITKLGPDPASLGQRQPPGDRGDQIPGRTLTEACRPRTRRSRDGHRAVQVSRRRRSHVAVPKVTPSCLALTCANAAMFRVHPQVNRGQPTRRRPSTQLRGTSPRRRRGFPCPITT